MSEQTNKPQQPKSASGLFWLVVNPDGKLLAILDSESEAYWFTRNRGHANGAVYFKAPTDYAAAPDLLEACKAAFEFISEVRNCTDDKEAIDLLTNDHAEEIEEGLKAAIAKAGGAK